MKDSKIDYSKLNDRIVEQAVEAAFPTVLTEDMLRKLIQGKIERAKMYSKAFNRAEAY